MINFRFYFIGLKEITSKFFLLQRTDRNIYIEGMRALAVILVFNVHYFAQFIEHHYFLSKESNAFKIVATLNAGLIGVDLFFVLSGYLLYKVLAYKQYTFRSFIENRLKRLLPVNFWILVLIILLNGHFNTGKFLLNLFFLQNFLVSNPTYNFVNWSLSWEWLFYVLIFFSIRLSGNKNYLLLCFSIVAIVLLILNQLFFSDFFNNYNFKLPGPGRFLDFYMGVFVAIAERSRIIEKSKGYILSLVYLLLLLFCIPFLGYILANYTATITESMLYQNLFFVASGLVFSLLLYITNNYEIGVKRIFSGLFFRIIGQISYSFYLIHGVVALPIVNMLYTKIISEINTLKDVFFCYIFSFIITFFGASFFYYFFERPYMIKNNTSLYKRFYEKLKSKVWPG